MKGNGGGKGALGIKRFFLKETSTFLDLPETQQGGVFLKGKTKRGKKLGGGKLSRKETPETLAGRKPFVC